MLENLKKLTQKAKNDEAVLAVMLFGSYARNEKFSDIDVCIILKPQKYKPLFLSKKKLEYTTAFPNLDIQIYQQLPLYIKTRIHKDNKTILCKNQDQLYDLTITTIRQFEYFKQKYLSYLEGVTNAR